MGKDKIFYEWDLLDYVVFELHILCISCLIKSILENRTLNHLKVTVRFHFWSCGAWFTELFKSKVLV